MDPEKEEQLERQMLVSSEADAVDEAHRDQIKILYRELYVGIVKANGGRPVKKLAAEFQLGLTYARLAREMAMAGLNLQEPAIE